MRAGAITKYPSVETDRDTNSEKEVGEMTIEALSPMHLLEGRHVNVALRDGSGIDDCQLVSVHRPGAQTVWLFVDGIDVFLPVAAIVACWEAAPAVNPRTAHTQAISRREAYGLVP
jgi:hypothetical protein